MNSQNANKVMLILLVLLISAVFFSMLRPFLMTIFMAGIFSALAYPLYARFARWFGGRQVLASLTTLFLIVLLVLIPLIGLIGLITAQAISIGESVTPWVQAHLTSPHLFNDWLQQSSFYDQIAPYRDVIYQKVGEAVAIISRFLINNLSSLTVMTVNLLFLTFIMLYTMFFFLMDGKVLLKKIMYYVPLGKENKENILGKFTSVTHATIMGTAIIAIIQGALAGIAFWIVGIPGAAFWALIMAILSFIPGLGIMLVWIPAAIILAIDGYYLKAIGLAVFCGAIIGTLDNILRPILVGKKVKMHELLIFFGILGGLFFFGVPGFIIGPIVAALFITLWEIYGIAFEDVLQANSKATPQKKP